MFFFHPKYCLFTLFTLISTAFCETQICNQNTAYECVCNSCWDSLGSDEYTIDWITVVLEECPTSIDEHLLRQKLTAWINEECNSVLLCNISLPLKENQLVIGHYQCNQNERQLRLLVLKDAQAEKALVPDNVLEAQLLGRVLQSREHVLSFLLRSGLQSVTVLRRFPRERLPLGQPPVFFVLLTLVISIFSLGLILYFAHVYINWKRFVQGKWKHKVYKNADPGSISLDEQILMQRA